MPTVRLGLVRATVHRLAAREVRSENGGGCVNELTRLANLHGTDKGTTAGAAHGYTTIYEQYLEPMRESAKKVLEIGIAGGASLKMWHDYFPNAEIYGLDHNLDYCSKCVTPEFYLRVFPLCGEATEEKTWRNIEESHGKDFDFICDDGGHYSSQIVPAFEGAWPLLRSGGIYCCEDLHQIFLQEKNSKETAFDYFAGFMARALHEDGEGQCGRPVNSSVEFMHWYKSLLIIKKR